MFRESAIWYLGYKVGAVLDNDNFCKVGTVIDNDNYIKDCDSDVTQNPSCESQCDKIS